MVQQIGSTANDAPREGDGFAFAQEETGAADAGVIPDPPRPEPAATGREPIRLAPPPRLAMAHEIARWRAVESVWDTGATIVRMVGYGALFAMAIGGLDMANLLGGALLADCGTHALARGLHWPTGATATNREAGMLGLGVVGFVVLEGWPAIPADPQNRALAFLGFLAVLSVKGIPRIHGAMRH